MPDPKVSDSPNQEQLAEMIGISVDTLNNYKKLTELIPELEDLVDEDDSLKQGIHFCKVEINLCSKL